MRTTLVHIRVKPEARDAFVKATLDNCRHTRQEPGSIQFEFLHATDDPDRFLLYEVFRDDGAVAAHKQTAHYLRWRDTVADMMAEPRQGEACTRLFPADEPPA